MSSDVRSWLQTPRREPLAKILEAKEPLPAQEEPVEKRRKSAGSETKAWLGRWLGSAVEVPRSARNFTVTCVVPPAFGTRTIS